MLALHKAKEIEVCKRATFYLWSFINTDSPYFLGAEIWCLPYDSLSTSFIQTTPPPAAAVSLPSPPKKI